MQVITCHYAPFGAAGRRLAGSSCPTAASSLCTREPLGRHAGSAGLMGGFAGKIRMGENFGGFFLLWGAKYPGKALQSQKKYDILAS